MNDFFVYEESYVYKHSIANKIAVWTYIYVQKIARKILYYIK